MNVVIKRLQYLPNETLGVGTVFSGTDVKYMFKTLELPWLDNKPQVSCIPAGKYKVIQRTSEKHGPHWLVLNVPGRELILIHSANYIVQLRGCIAVGEAFYDINGDKTLDITNSRATMLKLNGLLKDFELEII
jgi:hypothetical protein